MQVLITGEVTVYLEKGEYEIIVNSITEDGLGQLFVALEQLKNKLSKEGLFNDEFKKPLPPIPKRIGVITSSGGAAIKDILKTIRLKSYSCEIFIFPSLVQGSGSADEITRQIRAADTHDFDCLIVGRGGGSSEDLWSFNSENVVRAVFDCKTPVISAVGHQKDTTLIDYVSDVCAHTPTDAANKIINQFLNSETKLIEFHSRLLNISKHKFSENKNKLDMLLSKSLFKNANLVYESQKTNFEKVFNRFNSSSQLLLSDRRNSLSKIKQEYVIRHPCKMQLDQSRYNLNELETRLIDAMDLIINAHKVNLDKASDKFKFHSEKLLTSKRHELEISKSYLITNPCMDKIDLSRKELVSNKNKIIKEVNLKVESDKRELGYILEKNIFKNPDLIYLNKSRDFEFLCDKFISKSNELILTKRYELDSIKNKTIIKNRLHEHIESGNEDLENLKLRLNRSYRSKINKNDNNLKVVLNKRLFKSPEMIYESKIKQLDKIKSSNCIKNPHSLLDDYKAELKIYEEKLDKINQVIMLKKDQEKQKATYQRIIVAIAVLVIILLVIVFGGIL